MMTAPETTPYSFYLKPNRSVTVFSDQHMPLPELNATLDAMDIFQRSGRRDPVLEQNQWLIDVLTTRDAPAQNILLGDVLQLHPVAEQRKKLIRPVLGKLTEQIVNHGITREDLILTPGNHDPLELWPEAERQELVSRGVLQSGREMRLIDEGNSIIYRLMHGHREQPAAFNHDFFGNRVWVFLYDRISELLHRIRCSGQEWPDLNNPLGDLVNLTQTLWNARNLAPGELTVSGHTHYAALEPERGMVNVGCLDRVFDIQTGARISSAALELTQTSLRPGVYKPGDIWKQNADSRRLIKSLEQAELQRFGAQPGLFPEPLLPAGDLSGAMLPADAYGESTGD